MTSVSKTDRAQARATRLRGEARNCLTVAIREGDPGHAATLIDEAVRLTRRSEEIEAAAHR